MTKNAIADGIPMSAEQMKEYLQQHYGIPIAIKEQGTTAVTCPYCAATHHSTGSGYTEAVCKDHDWTGIVIGDRSFVPNYGFTVFTYTKKEDGVKELTMPDNLIEE